MRELAQDDNGDLIYRPYNSTGQWVKYDVPVHSATDQLEQKLELEALFGEYDDPQPIAEPPTETDDFDDADAMSAGECSSPARYEIGDLDKLVLMLTLWIPDNDTRLKLEEIYQCWKDLQRK